MPLRGVKMRFYMKNKNRKEKFFEELGDAVLELIMTAILFGIGIGAFALFGIGTENIDSDIAILTGIALIAVLALIIGAIAYLIKKKPFSTKRKNKKVEKENE